jgi:hypothetical protein
VTEEIKHVGNIDLTKKTSRIAPEGEDSEEMASGCSFNGQAYGEGQVICTNHLRLRCVKGRWSPDGSC